MMTHKDSKHFEGVMILILNMILHNYVVYVVGCYKVVNL